MNQYGGHTLSILSFPFLTGTEMHVFVQKMRDAGVIPPTAYAVESRPSCFAGRIVHYEIKPEPFELKAISDAAKLSAAEYERSLRYGPKS